MTFTHLHVHSHYSVLDGMSKVPDLVDKAIKLGMPAIALTDHGCMYGIKELLDCCKKTNKKLKEKAQEEGIEYVPFKPIVGVEAYCARRGRLLRDKDLKAPNTEGKSYIVDQSGWHLILQDEGFAVLHSRSGWFAYNHVSGFVTFSLQTQAFSIFSQEVNHLLLSF